MSGTATEANTPSSTPGGSTLEYPSPAATATAVLVSPAHPAGGCGGVVCDIFIHMYVCMCVCVCGLVPTLFAVSHNWNGYLFLQFIK
jgi:hypothetical protein